MDHSKLPQKHVALGTGQPDMMSVEAAKEMYKLEDWAFFDRKFREFDAAIPKDTRELRLAAQGATVEALEFYEGLAPTDAMERMLAREMVVSHMTVMFFMKKANLSVNSPESQDRDIKHAQSFMNMFLKQQTAFAKHRNKGPQRIIVEKVTVGQGGQAIVGNVAVGRHTGPGGRALEFSEDLALSQTSNSGQKGADTAPHSRDDTPLRGLV